MTTDVSPVDVRRRSLRLAATGGLAFVVLYVVHLVLQGLGPDGSSGAAVAAYNIAHRGALRASEVAVGLALLAFIAFIAPLVPVLWRAGQETLAAAVLVAGATFVALGFVSNAAETALIGVADTNEPAAVLALFQLQGRVPVIFAVTALAATISLAGLRTGLLWRWLDIAGLRVALVFLLGSVFSLLGSTPEGGAPLGGRPEQAENGSEQEHQGHYQAGDVQPPPQQPGTQPGEGDRRGERGDREDHGHPSLELEQRQDGCWLVRVRHADQRGFRGV